MYLHSPALFMQFFTGQQEYYSKQKKWFIYIIVIIYCVETFRKHSLVKQRFRKCSIYRLATFVLKSLTKWIKNAGVNFPYDWEASSWYLSKQCTGMRWTGEFLMKSCQSRWALSQHTRFPRSRDIRSIPTRCVQKQHLIAWQFWDYCPLVPFSNANYLLPKRDFLLIWLLLANSRFFTKISNSQMTLSRGGKVELRWEPLCLVLWLAWSKGTDGIKKLQVCPPQWPITLMNLAVNSANLWDPLGLLALLSPGDRVCLAPGPDQVLHCDLTTALHWRDENREI